MVIYDIFSIQGIKFLKPIIRTEFRKQVGNGQEKAQLSQKKIPTPKTEVGKN